nr:hypothetical protein [Bradyrhizobium diazoefficiens]
MRCGPAECRDGTGFRHAGSALGVMLFHRVNETVFRKTVLVLLLLSGISLI